MTVMNYMNQIGEIGFNMGDTMRGNLYFYAKDGKIDASKIELVENVASLITYLSNYDRQCGLTSSKWDIVSATIRHFIKKGMLAE